LLAVTASALGASLVNAGFEPRRARGAYPQPVNNKIIHIQIVRLS